MTALTKIQETFSTPHWVPHRIRIISHRTKRGTVWVLCDTSDQTYYALALYPAEGRYGSYEPRLQILTNGLWQITKSTTLEKDLVHVERMLGLRPRALTSVPLTRLDIDPAATPNQWTRGSHEVGTDYTAWLRRIQEEAPPSMHRVLWRKVKQGRYQAMIDRQRFDWERAYAEDAPLLYYAFREMSEDLCYTDNWRVALVGNKKHMKHYEKIRARGCCGSVDEIRVVRGKSYRMGFNYGH